MSLWIASILAMVVTVCVVLWLAATSGAATDYETGVDRLKQHLKWWHGPFLLAALVIVPWAAVSMASSAGKADVEGGYRQFLNGALVSTSSSVTECHEDGSCHHTYDCDPYTVHHPATYDSNGKMTSPGYDTTEYRSCPTATKEYTYWVTSSLGDNYTIADHIYASDPVRWRSGHSLKEDVPRGVPPEWTRYGQDIAAGYPDPVTKVGTYVNYILASQDTVLKSYSDEVDNYLNQGLLPEHTAGFLKGDPIMGRWDADKISFVGFKPPNKAAWESALMRFNSALGMQLRGDLHMVAVNNSRIGPGSSESYANALKAYWLGPKMGKKALAKNTIMVAIGVNTATGDITWSRAKTGMPVGNGAMLSAMESRLTGLKFDPTVILGKVRETPVKGKDGPELAYSHSNGALEKIVFNDFPFARVCMACKDKDEKTQTSFVYLEADIKLPGWAPWLAGFIGLLGGAIVAGVIVLTTPLTPLDSSYRSYYN